MYHQMLECCWQTRVKTANSEIQEAFRFLVSIQRYSFSSKVEYNHVKSTAQGALVKGYSAIDDFGDLLDRDGARVGGVRGQSSHGQQCVRRSIQITVSGA